MKLYLLRHAEAEDAKDDADRHLTRKGRKDVRALGKELRRHKLRVKQIWHSGIARAVETAEEIAPYLRGGAKPVKRPGLAPNDSPSKMAQLIAKRNEHLMIVGHEPFLGKLAAQLVLSRSSAAIVKLRKPSVVCLQRDDDADDDDDDDSGWLICWMLPVRT